MDASNLLKPALAQGTLRCIGSTTYKEFRQYFEKDRALVRRFQKIDVNEPSIPDAIEILKGLKPYFEEFHKLRYTNDAVKAAVELSARYIHDRKLPDKAIDVIDETGRFADAAARSQRKKMIGVKEIEATIATMARIPPKSRLQGRRRGAQAPRETIWAAWSMARTRPSSAVAAPSSWRAPACASRKSRSAAICSPAPPASARPRSPSQLAAASASNSLRFDMSRIYGAPHGQPPDRRAARLCRLRPGRSAHRRASTSIRIACCCSTRSRRPIPTSTTSCCR